MNSFTSPDLLAALDRLESVRTVHQDDAALLFGARGDALERLLLVAAAVRDDGLGRAGRSGIITYSKKVFIPITQLCRDRCHYCVFVDTPGGLAKRGLPTYMSPEQILEVAREGAALGCKEALFTLGDRPEDRWPAAQRWLDEHGYGSTLEYVRAMAVLVLEETGLLPHLNPGVMSWAELQHLRPVAPSLGMMLETTATRLWSEKGGVHFGSPDKDPSVRLQVLEDAGRSQIPFTTGVLLGIGENDEERAEALFAIRRSHERHGHIQETIVQNFRAKPRTAMQNEADLALQEYVAAVAVARVVMGPDMSIQVPPNLSDAAELGLLVRAGIDDWGGVSPLTADHVNPERPWPQLDALAELTRASGFELHERLTARPDYIRNGDRWLDPRLRTHVGALTQPDTGLAVASAPVVGRPWKSTSAPRPRRRTSSAPKADRQALPSYLSLAVQDPAGLPDFAYEALLGADGDALAELCAVADEVRSELVGPEVSYVANRNLDSSLFDPGSSRAGALDIGAIAVLAREAHGLGATEICVQGGLAPHIPGEGYLDVLAAIRDAEPRLHVHALRPVEIADGARRVGVPVRRFLQKMREAGADSVPGTGARILDDDIRAVLSEQTDPPVAEWVDVITAAHEVGLRSTATMVYGHVESDGDIVAHLRRLIAIQDVTGGFTEFIPMPFVPVDAPPSVAAMAGRGPDIRKTRAVHAVARLMLAGRIDHVQASWTKIGLAGAQSVLQGGADDLGGLLLDGTVRPDAGAEAHRELRYSDVRRLADEIGRPIRQRTTDYGRIPAPEAPKNDVVRRLLPVLSSAVEIADDARR
jgi:FO synthase